MSSFAATVSELARQDDPRPGTGGVWVVTDAESDEMFVVVAGRASIELLDRGDVINVVAGDVGVLTKGERTRWTIHERLREVYQIVEST